MLRNLRIRSKLLLLVLVPLLGLLAFAAVGATTRSQAATEAGRISALVSVAGRIDGLVAALQHERRISLQAVQGEQEVGGEPITAARTGTDDALAEMLDVAQQVDIAEEDSLFSELSGQSANLQPRIVTRELIDEERVAGFEVDGNYTRMIDGLVASMRTIGSSLESAGASDDIATLAALTAIRETAARELPLLELAFTEASFRDGDFAELITITAIGLENQVLMLATMREEHAEIYSGTLRNEDVESVRLLREQAIATGGAGTLTVLPDQWAVAAEGKIALLEENSRTIAADIVERAAVAGEAVRREVALFIGVSVAVVLVSLALAAVIARQTARPLLQLTRAANDISTERLPSLVQTLRTGDGAQTAELVPIGIDSRDEVGSLARAFDDIQATAVQTAVDLSVLLRRGIGDLFVNLARRNQSLLDRQITVLDTLERHEDDSDALEGLFKLDHLATRMRRNAESLLVLAGAETPRRWRRPVSVEEIIRASIGEVEDYARVEVIHVDDVDVSGRAAADLAHLLAELVENATIYSPPSTTVTVRTDRDGDGLGIQISDCGLGMGDDALEEANRLLADPPMAGFGLTRSLGFVVAGLLGRRLGITVRLERGAEGGVTAHAALPAGLLGEDTGESRPAEPAGASDAVFMQRRPQAAATIAERSERSQRRRPEPASPTIPAALEAPEVQAVGEQPETQPVAPNRDQAQATPARTRRSARRGLRGRQPVAWSVPSPGHLRESSNGGAPAAAAPSAPAAPLPVAPPAPAPVVPLTPAAPAPTPPPAAMDDLPTRLPARPAAPAAPVGPVGPRQASVSEDALVAHPESAPTSWGPAEAAVPASGPAQTPVSTARGQHLAGAGAAPLPVRGGGSVLPRRRPQAPATVPAPGSRLLASAPKPDTAPSDTSDILARYLSTMGGSRNGDSATNHVSGDDDR